MDQSLILTSKILTNLVAVLFKRRLIIFYYYYMCLVAVNAIGLISLHMMTLYSLIAVCGYHVYQDIWRPEIGDQ